jgi:hypothetical protein
MVALWLIEFLLAAAIIVAAARTLRRMAERAGIRSEANRLAHRRLRFEEARAVVLDHVLREVERGVPFEKAALHALSGDRWSEPEAGAGAVHTDVDASVPRMEAEPSTEKR